MGMERRIRDLSLLTERERRQVLVEWNRTETEYPRKTLPELFTEQVRRTPQAVALESGQGQMTYQDLDRQANQVAHYLRMLGVGAEVRVAICMERSLELVVGLLGILKAGGAYVPLDPGYPKERLQFIVEDGHAAVVLTQKQFVQHLGSNHARVICQEDKREEIAKMSTEGPDINIDVRNLAYVIYTSGSTGKPKGVGIVHENASALMYWAREVYSREELDGVLASTSICFDLSVFEIFVPLSWGGRVIVGRNALDLPQWKGTNKVRLVNTVPSAMGELLRMQGVPDSVRTVNLAGEALHRNLVNQLYDQKNIQRVCNLYGPSEDTTYSSYANLGRDERAGSVPIGRPIAMTQMYVMDHEFQLTPPGVAGELYIAGEGLARGYLNRPDLTAERFVPNPFAGIGMRNGNGTGGARMYKTGDKVRWRRDGELEFLGRLDHQVKLRGFRIELGEIESALLKHQSVREAIVMVREVAPGDQRLVAYVVSSGALSSSGDELKRHLQVLLPEYMVPSHVVRLEKMPLTPNGKVNRGALPLPDRSLVRAEKQFVPPRDALQQKLVSLWEELLVTRPIGIEDDFFEIGGHSLLATQLMAKIQEQTGKYLPLMALFEGPTIQRLSQLLRQQAEATSWSPLVPIQPGGKNPPLFIFHSVDGGLRPYFELAPNLGPDQPLYGLQSRSTNPEQSPHTQLEAMAAEYVEAIRAFRPAGPYLLGGWSIGGVIAFEVSRQLQQQGHQVAGIALMNVSGPPQGRVDDVSNRSWLMARFIDELGVPLGVSKDLWAEITALPPMAQMNHVWSEARNAGVIAADMPLTAFRHTFDSFKATLQMVHRYAAGPYEGRITLLNAGQVSAAATEDTAAPSDSSRGWGRLAAGGAEVVETPGTHYSMMKEPDVKVLAEQLRIFIQKALELEAVQHVSA